MEITITQHGADIFVESPLKENGVLIEGQTITDRVRPGEFWGDSRRGLGRAYGWLLAQVGQTVEIEDW